jgi:hypothetical protein
MQLMTSAEIGFLASALVLAAFGMKDMVNLRIVAICSNFAFIAYGCCSICCPSWCSTSFFCRSTAGACRKPSSNRSTI